MDDNICDCGMVGYKYGVGNCPNCDDLHSPSEEEAPSSEGGGE